MSNLYKIYKPTQKRYILACENGVIDIAVYIFRRKKQEIKINGLIDAIIYLEDNGYKVEELDKNYKVFEE